MSLEPFLLHLLAERPLDGDHVRVRLEERAVVEGGGVQWLGEYQLRARFQSGVVVGDGDGNCAIRR
jgi:hypothetical protein